ENKCRYYRCNRHRFYLTVRESYVKISKNHKTCKERRFGYWAIKISESIKNVLAKHLELANGKNTCLRNEYVKNKNGFMSACLAKSFAKLFLRLYNLDNKENKTINEFSAKVD
ncbi:hypothetical protein MHBO_000380, partial [Bonamia ostreae]